VSESLSGGTAVKEVCGAKEERVDEEAESEEAVDSWLLPKPELDPRETLDKRLNFSSGMTGGGTLFSTLTRRKLPPRMLERPGAPRASDCTVSILSLGPGECSFTDDAVKMREKNKHLVRGLLSDTFFLFVTLFCLADFSLT
jgi:hypothetical protein